ncbi:MAG: hypothetical protein JWN72_1084 [Thermoleophilia bacterium]|nr:hypothetical protein [Thermoleophilia bacterium]
MVVRIDGPFLAGRELPAGTELHAGLSVTLTWDAGMSDGSAVAGTATVTGAVEREQTADINAHTVTFVPRAAALVGDVVTVRLAVVHADGSSASVRVRFKVAVDAEPPTMTELLLDGARMEADLPAVLDAGVVHALDVDVFDEHTGVSAVEAHVDGESVPVVFEGAHMHVPLQLEPGAHVVVVLVRDAAGNELRVERHVAVRERAVSEAAPPTTKPVVDVTAPASVAGPSSIPIPAAVVAGGRAAAPRPAAVMSARDRVAPSLRVEVRRGAPGELQRTNRLVLRVRASERSLWRLRIQRFGHMRSTLAFSPSWRTVVINLGDRNAVGQLLNRTPPGGRVRLRIQVHGWDRSRNVAARRWVTVVARA